MPEQAETTSVRILVVEDDRLVGDAVRRAVEQMGYAVDQLDSAEQAEQAIGSGEFDLAVVDIGLPSMDGLELIDRVRSRGMSLPILVLTARDGLDDRVRGLELGADDYMAKPFEVPELMARIRALLRRSLNALGSEVKFGTLCLDLRKRRALLGDQPLDLTGREWSILEFLMVHAGEVVGKDKILQTISSWENDLTPNAIEVYVSRLRPKIEAGGLRIRTVRGLGYRLESASP